MSTITADFEIEVGRGERSSSEGNERYISIRITIPFAVLVVLLKLIL